MQRAGGSLGGPGRSTQDLPGDGGAGSGTGGGGDPLWASFTTSHQHPPSPTREDRPPRTRPPRFPGGDGGPPMMMNGDWICPSCRDLQFARNAVCRKCSTPRPGGVCLLCAGINHTTADCPNNPNRPPGGGTVVASQAGGTVGGGTAREGAAPGGKGGGSRGWREAPRLDGPFGWDGERGSSGQDWFTRDDEGGWRLASGWSRSGERSGPQAHGGRPDSGRAVAIPSGPAEAHAGTAATMGAVPPTRRRQPRAAGEGVGGRHRSPPSCPRLGAPPHRRAGTLPLVGAPL